MEGIIRSSMQLKALIEDMTAIVHNKQGQSRVRRKSFSVGQLIKEMVDRYRENASEKQIDCPVRH